MRYCHTLAVQEVPIIRYALQIWEELLKALVMDEMEEESVRANFINCTFEIERSNADCSAELAAEMTRPKKGNEASLPMEMCSNCKYLS
ncbi:hypothetical protein E2C01_004244 [Portunus trituberculatus]|uniref:Uncharacterized protein n=1 Tax=Portunus trituberculatus TaxID=210409 RepID=A0A5B7CTI2_PORTR|nr:hypothetical protein [Portunus trituberculatus]